jgi:hypothetical protein
MLVFMVVIVAAFMTASRSLGKLKSGVDSDRSSSRSTAYQNARRVDILKEMSGAESLSLMETQSLVVKACEGERLQKILSLVMKMAREEGLRKDLKSKPARARGPKG